MIESNASFDSIAKLIILIKAFIPDKVQGDKVNKLKSLYQIRHNFTKANVYMTYYCCQFCDKLLLKTEKCLTCVSSLKTEFLHLPLLPQIETLFKRKIIRDAVFNRDLPLKENVDTISSIKDGSIYREHIDFLNFKTNISFSLYADGVAMCKSINASVWPIFLTINELPRHLRYRKENTLLLGLWYDKSHPKPNFNTFLLPSKQFFDTMFSKGVYVEYLENGKLSMVNIKGIIMFSCGDSPARAGMQNMHQYNGHFGCLVSLQDPKTLETILQGEPNAAKRQKIVDETFSKSTLLYNYDKDAMVLRTSTESYASAEQAEKLFSKDHIYGIKGITILSKMIKNYIESMSPDAMHALFSGLAKD